MSSACIALGEVAGYPVRWLAELPLAATLTLRAVALADVSSPLLVHLTTSQARYQVLTDAGEVVLSPTEYEALALCLADGRTSREEALEELRRKAQPLGHRITLEGLVGAHRREWTAPARRGWSGRGGRGDRRGGGAVHEPGADGGGRAGEPWRCLCRLPGCEACARGGVLLAAPGVVRRRDEARRARGEEGGTSGEAPPPTGPTVGELCRLLGAELVGVEVEGG